MGVSFIVRKPECDGRYRQDSPEHALCAVCLVRVVLEHSAYLSPRSALCTLTHGKKAGSEDKCSTRSP